MIDTYYFNYLKLKIRKLKRIMSLPRKWLVLDVGSGNAPFPRADVICDKLADDTDRVGPLAVDDRPFVMGDITALPFLDGSFDFVYCSHVLEHVNDPSMAIKELMRVGKRGYIECHTEFQEKIRATPSHKWYVGVKSGTLIFRPKEKQILDECIHENFSRLINAGDPAYMNLFFKHNYSLFNSEYYWDKEIKFQIEGSAGPERPRLESWESAEKIIAALKKARATRRRDWKEMLKRFAVKISGGGQRVDIRTIIACPHCRQALESVIPDKLRCAGCGRHYPAYRGSPILLKNIRRNETLHNNR